jgi:hypothetical protein
MLQLFESKEIYFISNQYPTARVHRAGNIWAGSESELPEGQAENQRMACRSNQAD